MLENMMLPKVHIFMVMYCCQLIIEFVYPFVVIISLQQFVLSVFYTSTWSFGLALEKIGNKNKAIFSTYERNWIFTWYYLEIFT